MITITRENLYRALKAASLFQSAVARSSGGQQNGVVATDVAGGV